MTDHRAAAGHPSGLGLYVHIPFCVHKCPYCDFNSAPAARRLRSRYLAALEREICSSLHRGASARSLFLGGGTPSELTIEQLTRLMAALRQSFRLDENTECTIECNPGTLSLDFLMGLGDLGFNRLSVGVQSFSDRLLARLGRLHDINQARQSLRWARQTGFRNINIDLIFAVPGQTLQEWTDDLYRSFEYAPEHLSLYQLTVEEGTEFARKRASGQLKEASEALSADMYELAMDLSEEAGYLQYEISNFAQPGFCCLHNQGYWENRPSLGFGVSAASYQEGTRWVNTANWERYMAAAGKGPIPRSSQEQLSPREAAGEEAMLRLRTSAGLPPEELSRRYNIDFVKTYSDTIQFFLNQQLLVQEDSSLRLTRRGKLLANEVCAEFLV